MVRRAAAVALALIFGTYATASALPQIAVHHADALPPLDPRGDPEGWSAFTTAHLTWDVQGGHPAREPTTVHVAIDGSNLLLRFDVVQHEAIADAQHTNDTGQGTDDAVWIDIWPTGLTGYQYQFAATPNGTHYQSSSENAVYQPRWESYGSQTSTGYAVTMKIPLDVIRGAQSSARWNVQFVRYIRATGSQIVWSYDGAQTIADDPARAGVMTISVPQVTKPQPRAAAYVLAEAASPSIGGSTSRMGLDLSYPIASQISFYATFHPDYSNVELDQQTISPTVYPRAYAEVRPFFTQGANNFNQFYCNFCNGLTPLYTPAIPTPHSGYAVEGKAGEYGFTVFDAEGDQRSDQAGGLVYTTPDTRWTATVNRVSVFMPDFTDTVDVGGVTYNDLKHTTLYANYGNDMGTNVVQPDRAQYYDAGATWTSQTFSIWSGIHRIGGSFDPADGFILLSGVNGWGTFANKIFTTSANNAIAAYSIGGVILRNHDDDGPLNQTKSSLDADVLSRSGVDVNLTLGSSYQLLDTGIFAPTTQSGIAVTFHSGLQTNNPISFDAHGPSAYPTKLSFATGRYGDGRLNTLLSSSSIRIGQRGTLTPQLDETDQWFPSAASNVQWFESLAYTYQINRESSLSLGLRRITGMPPIPNGGGNCVGACSNVSAAYYLRLARSELYVAYGDPNALITAPQFIVKLILYAGADKGT